MKNLPGTFIAMAVALWAGAAHAEDPVYGEVLVDGARVQAGAPVIATLRRGEVYRIAEVRTGWYRVFPTADRQKSGYVRAAEMKLLAPAAVGTGLAGQVPETFAAARLSIDWQAGTFGLSATIPQAAGLTDLRLALPAGVLAEAAPAVRLSGANVEVQGTCAGLVACLTPGTRSFWITGQSGSETLAYRIDLPPLAALAEVETQKFPNFPEGLVLKIAVTGLLPGYVVEFAEVGAGPIRYRTVSTAKGAAPRIADALPRTGKPGVGIRLIVPYLTGETIRRFYYLRVRNPEGSTTQHLMLERTGEQFGAAAKLVGTASPAPVDGTVAAPDVEVLTATEAAAKVRALGLVPTLVDSATFAALDTPPADALVVRQGVPAGERLLAGSKFLLAVEGPDSFAARPDVPVLPVPAETDDALAFAPVASGQAAADLPVDEGRLSGESGETSAVALDVDPGLALEPNRPEDREARAALLRQLLAALARQPRGDALPGRIGLALMSGTAAGEEGFQLAVEDGREVDRLVGEPLLTAVVSALEVNLDAGARQTLLRDWSRYIAGRRTAAWLDRNGNGRLADDSAAWAVIWLFERGYFDPWSVTVVVPDAGGGPPLATFPEQPQQPPAGGNGVNWPGLLGLLLPGKPNVIVPPSSTSTSKPPKPPAPPAGKPLVNEGDGPDFVRVPAAAPELLGEVEPRFRDLGLKIARVNELFQSDKVVASDPVPRTWVPYASTVELDVRRLVPNVVKYSYSDASATLDRWKLRPAVAGSSAPGDVVVRQSPAAGEYVLPGDAVSLALKVMTPNVVGQQQSNAVTTLQKSDLGWRSSTKAFGNDQVVAQEPVAGELVEHGDKVELTLHLVMPDIRGRSLAAARRVLLDWDLEAMVLNRLAHEEDIVRGQVPAPGVYVPHGSTARVGPIYTTVPDVRGSSVGPTARRLRTVEDFDVRLYGDLVDEDEITMQSPAPGTEIERGSIITLDARVRVPNVRGEGIFAGRNAIQAAPGRLQVVFDVQPGDRDLVWGQDPQAGTLVFPRTRVVLIPGVEVPRLYDLSPQEARNEIFNAGLQVGDQSSSTRETGDRTLVGRSFVTGQSPDPGLYRRDRVRSVDLAYSTYILGLRTVPNVGLRDGPDLTSLQAIAAIQREDLVPILVYREQRYTVDQWRGFLAGRAIAGLIAGEAAGEPICLRSDPPAGTRVVIGTRVTLFLGDGGGF